jgi:hypothetical protein
MRLSSLSTVPLSSVCLRSASHGGVRTHPCVLDRPANSKPPRSQQRSGLSKERTVAGLTRAELAMIRRHLEPSPRTCPHRCHLRSGRPQATARPAAGSACPVGPAPVRDVIVPTRWLRRTRPPPGTPAESPMLVGAADGVATLSSVGADAGRAGPRRSTGGRQLQQLGRCLGGGQDETAKVAVSGVSRSDVPTYTR